MQQIDINELKPHPRYNEFFHDMTGEKWNEFLESVKSQGVIEPIVITHNRVIVSGHQRARACKELGINTIMSDVHTYENDDNIFLAMLYSNIERVKYIPSEIERVKIVIEIENIYKKREMFIKNKREEIIKNYRNEISRNREYLMLSHNYKCDVCSMDYKQLLEIHHILPLQQGGNNSLDNISCVCPNCHSILHKLISNYCHNSINKDELYNWIKRNYSYEAYHTIFELAMKYIRLKEKYGWEDLIWI